MWADVLTAPHWVGAAGKAGVGSRGLNYTVQSFELVLGQLWCKNSGIACSPSWEPPASPLRCAFLRVLLRLGTRGVVGGGRSSRAHPEPVSKAPFSDFSEPKQPSRGSPLLLLNLLSSPAQLSEIHSQRKSKRIEEYFLYPS